MEWTNERITRLIELFREKRVLWDATSVNFKDRNKKRDAWDKLGVEMEIDPTKIEKKIRMLIGQFQRELKKGKSGDGTDAPYKSKWIFFKTLLFLKDKNKPRHSTETAFSQKPSEQEFLESQDCNNSVLMERDAQSDLQMGKTRIPPKSISDNMKRKTDMIGAEAFSVMHQLSNKMQRRDEFDVFGELVAHSLRSLKGRSAQTNAKYEIYNILHRAETEDQRSSSSTSCSPAFSESAVTVSRGDTSHQ